MATFTLNRPLPAPRPATARPLPGAAEAGHGLGFALFILVNFALFVRPGDLLPALTGYEIYRYLIIACFFVSIPAILEYLAAHKGFRPIDLCVLLPFPIVLLSGVINASFEYAFETGTVYIKLLVYYFLFVSLVTTPRRLRFFLGCLLLFTTLVVILSALDFFEVIKLPRQQFVNGREVIIDPNRMYGPGIFSDPNDICVLIAASTLILFGRLADARAGFLRWLWLAPLAVFAFGFVLTQSRGGMLAVLAGFGMMIRLRYGWTKAILLGALGVPIMLLAVGGRQATISMQETTGQARIFLWSDGMVMFRAKPFFGVGLERFQEEAYQVAHNSYMQAFSELGFVGGICFLGAVLLGLGGLYRLATPAWVRNQPVPRTILDPDLRVLHPFLAGAIAAYAMGMFTLSLNTMATTFTIFGLANVFLARVVTQPPAEQDRFDLVFLVKLSILGVLFLAGMFIIIRLGFAMG